MNMIRTRHSEQNLPKPTSNLPLLFRMKTILDDRSVINIKNIQEPVIYKYFLSLNQRNFGGVAELFSAQGCLYPPFEKGICGREAICQYLQAEAIGIEAFPQSGTVEPDSCFERLCQQDSNFIYQILGYVKTSFFTVNVSWSIKLNPDREIVSVEVKLLAKLQDLLSLKQ